MPHLSEREFVERALHLANDCTDEQKVQAVSEMPFISQGLPIVRRVNPAVVPILRQHWANLAPDRAWFRAHVERVYQDPEGARRELRNILEKGLADIVPVSTLALEGG